MIRFFNNAKYIVAFCVLCVLIQLSLGEKFLEKFLMLVLFSMVILNVTPVVNLIKDTLGSDANYSNEAGNKKEKTFVEKYENATENIYNKETENGDDHDVSNIMNGTWSPIIGGFGDPSHGNTITN